MSHTPGPWSVTAEMSGNFSAKETIGDGEDFQPFGACGCCNSPWINGETDDEKRANARLIAAAPELLAALEKAAEYIDAAADLSAEPLLSLIDAAIAKAKGGA